MRKRIFISAIVTLATACQSVSPAFQQTLSAGDLTAAYNRSKEGVRRKYDGKEVSVRGYVPVQVIMPGNDEHEGLITLKEKNDGASQILCWFSKNEARKFAEVRAESYLTVKGVFNGERGTELRFCKLVEVE